MEHGHFDSRYLATHISQIMWQWLRPPIPCTLQANARLMHPNLHLLFKWWRHFYYIYYITKIENWMFGFGPSWTIHIVRMHEVKYIILTILQETWTESSHVQNTCKTSFNWCIVYEELVLCTGNIMIRWHTAMIIPKTWKRV